MSDESEKIANASLHQRADLIIANDALSRRINDLEGVIERLRAERIKLQAEVEKLRFMQFKQQTEGIEDQ